MITVDSVCRETFNKSLKFPSVLAKNCVKINILLFHLGSIAEKTRKFEENDQDCSLKWFLSEALPSYSEMDV